MISRTNSTPKQAQQCQERFEAAFTTFQADDSHENEKTLTALYEECSKYSKHCPVCVAGRAEFVRSINAIRSGNVSEAMVRMQGAFKSVRFKWSRIRAAMFGENG